MTKIPYTLSKHKSNLKVPVYRENSKGELTQVEYISTVTIDDKEFLYETIDCDSKDLYILYDKDGIAVSINNLDFRLIYTETEIDKELSRLAKEIESSETKFSKIKLMEIYDQLNWTKQLMDIIGWK